MKNKIFFSVLVIVLLLFNLSFNVIANAATSDLLISQGTGQYAITVTKTSTVDDIIKVLGEPKLTTPSAFGGEAYSFYTDDNYSNLSLHRNNGRGKKLFPMVRSNQVIKQQHIAMEMITHIVFLSR